MTTTALAVTLAATVTSPLLHIIILPSALRLLTFSIDKVLTNIPGVKFRDHLM